MGRLKKFKSSIIVLILQIIGTFIFWLILSPSSKIPIRWNINGKIDAYVNKTEGLVLFLVINILIFLILYFLPKISFRYKKNKKTFSKVIPKFSFVIVLMITLLHQFSLWMGTHQEFNYSINIIFVILGISFVLIGNLLPKIPLNFYMGIRTPWSLSSEENWEKTALIGGYSFSIAGILFFIRALILTFNFILNLSFFIIVLLTVLFPVIYSLFLYFKERKRN
ncbi:MAG: SdpI family protein [Candidatus Mcinerneyibacterium aminivorans]|uniref:SdpI family protein n=1 Tax=Candidatus Mcinerneyibacterium aminivorans TaxID=2703815 RepID=A0A5D0MBX0_9BACT|nr:MAG: SdpI family protein [Candidatus Mcinerneyibacterium aminivorans]